MTQAMELLSLVQRLRREAAREGDSELAIDLRLACRHLRQYAAQWSQSRRSGGPILGFNAAQPNSTTARGHK
jgi:hypothetical protein